MHYTLWQNNLSKRENGTWTRRWWWKHLGIHWDPLGGLTKQFLAEKAVKLWMLRRWLWASSGQASHTGSSEYPMGAKRKAGLSARRHGCNTCSCKHILLYSTTLDWHTYENTQEKSWTFFLGPRFLSSSTQSEQNLIWGRISECEERAEKF